MQKQKKKKLLYISDSASARTGFGGSSATLLKNLFLNASDKIEIHHLCCSSIKGDPQLSMFPWKCYGCLPNNQEELNALNNGDQHSARMAAYGDHALDDLVKSIKPDFIWICNDYWGQNYLLSRSYIESGKIPFAFHTTLDSLPILESAVKDAPKIKNFFVWSKFAEDEMHRLGHKHVKTLNGPIDVSKFYPLEKSKRVSLRVEQNIEVNAFVIGFVFRNQLRKSIDKLLLGYKMWKEKYKPTRPTYVAIHTNLGEGWPIEKFADEYGIDKKEILVTYICRNCKKYEVLPINGEELQCKYCQTKNLVSTSVRFGVTDEVLNEIFNLQSVYIQAFSSGAQENPIVQSALVGNPTACTNYSCGSSHVNTSNGVISPLDFNFYKEIHTNFDKASTKPESICETLQKFYTLPEGEKEQLGQKTRQWALDNFDSKKIAKFVENFIDEQPYVDYTTFSFEKEEKDPNAIIENSDNDIEWVKQLYKKILKTEVNEKDEGLKHWIERLSRDLSRQQVENYFRHVAREDNNKNKKIDFEDFLDAEDNKKILFVMPDSIGDVYLCTALFGSIKEMYPEYALYVATNQSNFDVLKGNPNIKKTIPYIPNMDQLVWLEGQRGHKGYFDIAFLPHITTQRMLGYMHNGKDKIEFDINKK